MGNTKSKSKFAIKSTDVSKHPPIETITRLQICFDRLEKRENHINKKIAKNIKAARLKVSQGDKRGAMQHIRRKKMYDRECNKLRGIKLTLQQQIINLEGAQINMQLVNALSEGTQALKIITQTHTIEEVEELRDDIEEQQQNINEVSDLLAKPLTIVDEDELEEEFNNMISESLNDELLTINLPEAPTTNVKSQLQEEEELKKLEVEMAM